MPRIIITQGNYNKRIHAIKAIRAVTGYSLKDAKDTADLLFAGASQSLFVRNARGIDGTERPWQDELRDGYLEFKLAEIRSDAARLAVAAAKQEGEAAGDLLDKLARACEDESLKSLLIEAADIAKEV